MSDNVDLHSNDSVVDEKFRNDTYAKIIPLRTFNYWLTTLYSEAPNVSLLNKNGQPNEEALARFEKIKEASNWPDLISKYVAIKSFEGFGALIVDFKKDIDGNTLPVLSIAEGVVKYNSFLETFSEVQVIRKYTRGIVPIIRIITYGKMFDTIKYKIEEGFDTSKISKEELQNIQNVISRIERVVHNSGIVRAVVFRNRVSDKHYDYGRSDTSGYEDLIKNLDLTTNRKNNEIDKNSTHLSRTLSTGNILNGTGGDDTNGFGEFGNVEENQTGNVKEVFRTLDTEEGVDSVIIQGDITLPNLNEDKKIQLAELDALMGIMIGFDAEGKTNDTDSKVERVGDPASREAKMRAKVERQFFHQVINVIKKIDKGFNWNEVDRHIFEPKINDYRLRKMMMENIDKISKSIPITKLYTDMFGITPDVAKKLLEEKEKEVMQNISSALAIMNHNLPQNLQVPFKWATTIEPENKMNNEEPNNNKKEVKK